MRIPFDIFWHSKVFKLLTKVPHFILLNLEGGADLNRSRFGNYHVGNYHDKELKKVPIAEIQGCIPKTVYRAEISVIIRACVTYHGVVCISKMSGKLIRAIQCLNDTLPSAVIRNFSGGPHLFQQDNSCCHSSTYTRQFFRINNIPRSTWPA